jgi:Cu+-exporting ATPase
LVSDNQTSQLDNAELHSYFRDLIISFIFTVPTFFIAMVVMMMLPPESPIPMYFMTEIVPGLSIADTAVWILATPVQFCLGYRFYRGSWKSLVYLKTANMDVLVALGTSTAYIFSTYSVLRNIATNTRQATQFFETSVFLIFFILLGKYLESYAKGRTSDAIQRLLSLTPDTATLVTFSTTNPEIIESESVIKKELVQVGDILRVLPGARFPCDGIIKTGSSYIDESMLTGESIPLFKAAGDTVLGGTVNQTGVVLFEARKTGSGNN